MRNRAVIKIGLLIFAGLAPWLLGAAQQPLSKDDILLLLIGGKSSQEMVTLIEQRGIDFEVKPDAATKFRDQGADDAVINALEKASEKFIASQKPAATSAPAAASAPTVPSPPSAPGERAASDAQAAQPSPSSPPVQPAPPSPSAQTNEAESAGEPPRSDRPVLMRRDSETSAVEERTAAAPGSDADAKARIPVAGSNADRGITAPPAGDRSRNPMAPTFSLTSISGRRLNLENYRGKVVLLDFWATWCGPCRKEIPEFVKLQERYSDQGLQVIGVSLDRAQAPVERFYSQYSMNYPVAISTAKVRQLYGGLSSVPTTLLIGRDGRIYRKVVGSPVDLRVFEGEIRALLADHPEGGAGAVQVASNAPGNEATPPAASVPLVVTDPTSANVAGPVLARAKSQSGPSTVQSASSAGQSGPASSQTKPASGASNRASAPDLKDPSPDEVQKIIQEFSTKEKLFKEARDNYTFHQINKVQTLDPDLSVIGTWEQEWDILFDDSGNRIERVTYAPVGDLKVVLITKEDLDAMRRIQPFVLTSDELPEYDVKYLGHVRVDELTTYVFQIRPKEIKKGRQYFQGEVWVDDRDLQIVKTEGKNVPELHDKRGENLFPRFTTYREQIDGKYWFPTFTMADDKLYFPGQPPVHIKEVIRYTDYKQFKSKSRIIGVSTDTKSMPPPSSPPPKP